MRGVLTMKRNALIVKQMRDVLTMKKILNCKNALRAFVALFVILALFLFSPLTNRLYAFLEVQSDVRRADAIILLSCGYYDDDILERNSYQRLFHAFRLYKKGYADRIIIAGGVLRPGRVAVSEAMKNVLIEMGMDAGKIHVETDSQNTYENLKNVRPLLARWNVRTSLLVTSSYHMYRALGVARRLGIAAHPAPVPCYEKRLLGANMRSRFVIEVVREYGAIVFFKLKGWI